MASPVPENEKIAGSVVVLVKGDISEIDWTSISRSVFVTGFRAHTTPEDLIIHFQRRKNGGGDIEKIVLSKKGTAVITFDRPEDFSSIQQQEQHFQEVILTVKPYMDTVLTKNDQGLEVFEVVSADLDLEFVQSVSLEQTRALLKDIGNENGVRWIEKAETFSISGTFQQVEQTRNFLKETVSQSNGITVFTGLKRKDVSQERPPSHREIENQEDVSQNINNGSHTDDRSSAISLQIQDFEIEPKIFKVFIKAYEEDLHDMEAKYHVQIPKMAEGSKLSLKPESSCTANDYEEACNQFISLYQKMFQRVKRERFSLKNEKKAVPARDTINKMGKRLPILVQVSQDRKHWELYGEAGHIEEAFRYLEHEGVEIKREQEQFMEEDSQDYSSGVKTTTNRLETFLLDGKVKVSVYKGDITMEKVDAIVNAANGDLSHVGGVAKAILDRGGKTIREESRAIIRRFGVLKDGEAVTTRSGKLPCSMVIHAVGPKWDRVEPRKSKRILHQACLNAFSEAEKLSLDSIAIPAIGSGIYGVPKDVCAEVMLDAVEEYVTKVSRNNKKLTDIRLVDLEDLSVQAFQTEFLCRYGDKPVTESGSNLKAQPRSNRGRRGKGRGSKGSGSTNNSPGSSDARDDHPLSATATSYSGAVKRNVGEKDGKAPTTADGAKADKEEEEKCPICLDHITGPRRLKCRHVFCSGCLQQALKVYNRCPVCQEPQGVLRGNQPRGEMKSYHESSRSLPGYPGCGTIIIRYYFPSGVQGPEHPHPGHHYEGTSREAYLPGNREGREVLQLLYRAFDNRLVFTVGTSNTTGRPNQVVWNDIHHKTSTSGGPTEFGYPDPDYLRRVKEELAAKGIR